MEEASLVVSEKRADGIPIRPALAVPLEVYGPERKAEFLLSNAVDPEDYSAAVEDVKRLGLDPDTILHDRPAGVKKESELGR